jgi:hypothetical protein
MDRRSREAQRTELVRKLDLEISNRIDTLTQMLDSLTSLDNYQMGVADIGKAYDRVGGPLDIAGVRV